MLLGLDCGFTAIKAVMFGEDGVAVAVREARKVGALNPAPGLVEQDHGTSSGPRRGDDP